MDEAKSVRAMALSSMASPRARRIKSHVEDSIQTSIVAYLRTVLPSDKYRVFSVPNGAGRCSPAVGRRRKAMGLLAGVFDLEILGPQGRSWRMEVKTDDGVLSDAQKDFQDFCVVSGVPYAVARSIDDARKALVHWGLPMREAA